MTTQHIIQLKNVRITYPSLFVKKVWVKKDEEKNEENDEGKYQATFIINEENEAIAFIKQQLKLIADDELKLKATQKAQLEEDIDIGGNNNICLKSIKYVRNTSRGEHYQAEEYDNSFILTAKSVFKPSVVDNYRDAQGKQILITDESRIKSGDYVNVFIELYSYDKINKGIGARLRAVQYWREGDAFPEQIPDFDSFIDDNSKGVVVGFVKSCSDETPEF